MENIKDGVSKIFGGESNVLIIIVVTILSIIAAMMSRIWYLLNNPDKVKKIDGKIHWLYEIAYLFMTGMIGGFIGWGAYVIISYFEIVDSVPLLVFICSALGSVATVAFNLLQNKLIKTLETVDKKIDKKLDNM